MTEINGGEVLVRCLANEGIRFVFGLPCPEVDPLLAALERHDIRFVPVRHEAAAVHMAEGLYKTTGLVAAVLGNPGPGSANLIPGIITASMRAFPSSRSPRSIVSASCTRRRRPRSRARTNSTYSVRLSNGGAHL